MREIKFRAWIPSHLRMVEVCDLDIKGELISFIDYDGFYIVKWLSDVKLMQYTGVKDKYGREIYEGDILLDSHTEEYCNVVFEDGCYIAEFQTNTIELKEVVKDLEVVGNMYENSELIGEV